MRPSVVVPKLSPRQRMFAEKFAVLGNGRAAAIAAGYSQDSADMQASRLLRNEKVAAVVEREQRRRVERVDIEGDEVIATLANIMRTDVRDVMGWDDDGSWFESSESLPRSVASAIKEVRVTRKIDRRKNGEEVETVETRVVMHDKIAAASKLADLLGLMPDKGSGPRGERDAFAAGVFSGLGLSDLADAVAHMLPEGVIEGGFTDD